MHRGWSNRPGGDEGHGWGRGHERIHYTPEQHQQMMAINKDFKQRSEALFAQDNITLKQYKTGLIALQTKLQLKLEFLLKSFVDLNSRLTINVASPPRVVVA